MHRVLRLKKRQVCQLIDPLAAYTICYGVFISMVTRFAAMAITADYYEYLIKGSLTSSCFEFVKRPFVMLAEIVSVARKLI